MKLQRLDASVLIDIWLDGFASGVSSLAKNAGATNAEADSLADELSKATANDPAALEMVRAEVRERIQGIEGTPKSLTLFDKDGPR